MPVRVVTSGARRPSARCEQGRGQGRRASGEWVEQGLVPSCAAACSQSSTSCCLWLRCCVASSAQTTRCCRTNPAATAALSGRPVFEPHAAASSVKRQAASGQPPAVRSSKSAVVHARHAWTARSLTLRMLFRTLEQGVKGSGCVRPPKRLDAGGGLRLPWITTGS
jgi:hypothetical protein